MDSDSLEGLEALESHTGDTNHLCAALHNGCAVGGLFLVLGHNLNTLLQCVDESSAVRGREANTTTQLPFVKSVRFEVLESLQHSKGVFRETVLRRNVKHAEFVESRHRCQDSSKSPLSR